MSKFYNDSIFWIEVEKIKPNPYQPRKEFDEARLNDLASSIRQYGVLQPLVVTRKEIVRDDGIASEYELIAGERRLRASKLAGLSQVPVIIRSNDEDARVKLELAIIENLQREDLNPIDRALAFHKLVEEFNFKHGQIAQKIGKSREYVSNSIRLLALPEEIKRALGSGGISEGHARPILMLTDRPEEQITLFKEIIYKKLTVREAEGIARRIAFDKVRKKNRAFDPDIVELEEKLSESLGTRVHIETRDVGGKILIDFFSDDDLRTLLDMLSSSSRGNSKELIHKFIAQSEAASVLPGSVSLEQTKQEEPLETSAIAPQEVVGEAPEEAFGGNKNLESGVDDRSKEEKDEEDIYGLDNFSI